MNNRSGSNERGFSLVELLVTLVLSTVLLLVGFPAFRNMMERARVEGTVREASMMLSQARMEAIKRNRRALVQVRDEGEPTETLVAYVDIGTTDFQLDADDLVLGRHRLPVRVDWRSPDGTEGTLADTFGVVPNTAIAANGPVFEPDGSVMAVGALRIADEQDNFLEVLVSPAATGKIAIRKYYENTDASPPDAPPTGWYEAGQGGQPWIWK